MIKLLRKTAGEHGQMLMMTVITMSIVFVIGFIVVDFGFWFSERRGAQKDADLSALAAAQELLPIVTLDDPNATAIQQAANDRATEYAKLNDVTDPANILLPSLADSQAWTACWSDEGDTSDIIDTYPLDIKHPTRGLFGKIFSIADQANLGAHARACVGSVNSLDFVMPTGVPMNNPDYEKWIRDLCWSPDDGDPDNLPEPLYGKQCDLSVYDKVSGEASWMDLDHPDPEDYPPSDLCSEKGGGAKELGDEIAYGGANTVCRVAPMGFDAADCNDDLNWCVRSKTGAQPQTVMKAFNTLFSGSSRLFPTGEGDCDTTGGDGIDDFYGSFELTSAPGTEGTEHATYKQICDSPRVIDLIIVDTFDATGNSLMPIRAFATFFVEACRVNDVDDPKCDPKNFPGQIGHVNLVGRFVNIPGERGVGYPTDWSPKRIVLDE